MNRFIQVEERPQGISILVGYEILTGGVILSFLFLVSSSDPFSDFVINNLPIPASMIGCFLLAYGLGMGRTWGWWLTIILSLIGIVILWPNILVIIFILYEPFIIEHVLVTILTIVSYILSYVVIIFYLMKTHVKSYFNIKAVMKSSQNEMLARLPFIDFARGIVMVLMAWDHVSSFWNPGRRGSEGLLIISGGVVTRLRLEFPNFAQFLLRFITHWCAPTFIFLAGTALALSTNSRLARGESQRDISLRMIKRGIALLLLEAFVVAPAFWYNGPVPYLYFGVLACIGVSFILFSVIRRIHPIAILALSIFIILWQPFLDLDWLIPVRLSAGFRWYLKVILYQPNFEFWPYVGLYPILPWIGVMGLGWCFGIFLTSYDKTQINRLALPLIATGSIAIVLWFLVRLLNGYGNYLPRIGYTANTIQDWLYMGKYPPSLAFLLWTLGGMCFFLALGIFLQSRPNFNQRITGAILTFGKVPLFFYCTHLWIYKLWVGWWDRPISFQTNLIGTAILWLLGLIVLWRLCIWYRQLKQNYHNSLLKYI